MEEYVDVFIADSDALVYLAEPKHKKFRQNYFGAIHFVRTYLITNFSTPLPLWAPVNNFNDLPSISPVAYVRNIWPISQPKNK